MFVCMYVCMCSCVHVCLCASGGGAWTKIQALFLIICAISSNYQCLKSVSSNEHCFQLFYQMDFHWGGPWSSSSLALPKSPPDISKECIRNHTLELGKALENGNSWWYVNVSIDWKWEESKYSQSPPDSFRVCSHCYCPSGSLYPWMWK